jgi:hypothetical protein
MAYGSEREVLRARFKIIHSPSQQFSKSVRPKIGKSESNQAGFDFKFFKLFHFLRVIC